MLTAAMPVPLQPLDQAAGGAVPCRTALSSETERSRLATPPHRPARSGMNLPEPIRPQQRQRASEQPPARPLRRGDCVPRSR